MDIIYKILQFLMSLSFLVILHELGHFIPAKLFGTRVEKFYLFFNPWFSLFKFKKGETEYGVGWLPLGGYVKIAGMIDESMDTESLKKPAESWEFRAKPAWQRLIMMSGGVIVNLLLGFVIYAMMLFAWGEIKIDNQNTPFGYEFSDFLRQELKLETGDQIIAINNEPVLYFNQITEKLILAENLTVLRAGQKITLDIPKDFLAKLQDSANKMDPWVQLRFPLIVGQILPESLNIDAGLEIGDEIIAVNGEKIQFFDEFRKKMSFLVSEKVHLTILRTQHEQHLEVMTDENGKIGIVPKYLNLEEFEARGIYHIKVMEYGFFESFPAGVQKGIQTLTNYIRQLGLFFKPETKAYKSIGGFASIGNMFPSAWDAATFWNITAVLSIILAFMNILPIPALDGGHVLFLFYEMITGKAPNQKFLEIAQTIGMILLFLLLLYANGNDVFRFFYK